MERNDLVDMTHARLSLALEGLPPVPRELIDKIAEKASKSAEGFEIANPHHQEQIKLLLNKTRAQLIENLGTEPSRPLLVSAILIWHLQEPIDQKALAHFSETRYQEFALTFDLAQGIGYIGTSIAMAESQIAGNLDKGVSEMIQILSEHSPVTFKVPEQSDAYFELSPIAALYAEELMKDPSGFRLVDFVAKHISENRDLYPGLEFTINEVFMTGVRTGQTMYKAIYPLSENLPSRT